MRKFKEIIEDIKEPDSKNIWLHNGILKYFGSNGWVSFSKEDSKDIQELKEKVINLNKEIESIKSDLDLLKNSKTV